MRISSELYTKASKELEELIKQEMDVKDPSPAIAKAILNGPGTEDNDSERNDRKRSVRSNRQSGDKTST